MRWVNSLSNRIKLSHQTVMSHFVLSFPCACVQVRHYSPTRWVSTDAEAYFMGVGAAMAFRRLFQYITGANEGGEDQTEAANQHSRVCSLCVLFSLCVCVCSCHLQASRWRWPPLSWSKSQRKPRCGNQLSTRSISRSRQPIRTNHPCPPMTRWAEPDMCRVKLALASHEVKYFYPPSFCV